MPCLQLSPYHSDLDFIHLFPTNQIRTQIQAPALVQGSECKQHSPPSIALSR